VALFASWNGATTVARWQVLAGASRSALKLASSARRSGFETRIDLASSAGSFAVRALSKSGRVLATSNAVTAP
jgi:hypothetical protein